MPDYNPAVYRMATKAGADVIVATDIFGQILLESIRGAQFTQLDGAIDAAQIRIEVDSAVGIDVGEALFVGRERVRVVQIAGNILEVRRGDGQTDGTQHADDTNVYRALDQRIGDFAGTPVTNIPALLGALTDENALSVTITAHRPFEAFA